MFKLDLEKPEEPEIKLPTSVGSLKKQEMTTHGHHQMVNAKIKLITFFLVKDEEAVYIQQKQDLELTVAQIISFS